MANKTDNAKPNTDVSNYTASSVQMPQLPPSLAEQQREMSAKRAEAAQKVKELLEGIKKKAEAFKKDVLAKYKDEIFGMVILPPRPYRECPKCQSTDLKLDETKAVCAQCGEKWNTIDMMLLANIEGDDLQEINKKRMPMEDAIREIANKKLSDVNVTVVALQEIWDLCTKGKYDILNLIVVGMPVYDVGWVGALRLAEIHKQMVLKKFEKYIVVYGLAGSMARGEAKGETDVDTFVVINDTDVTRMTGRELVSKLRALIWGMGAQAGEMAGVRNKLNVQIWLLTEMWDALRTANPTIFTTVRDAVPLYDVGMFAPWKLLLMQGKITPTPESIDMFLKSGRQMIDRTKAKLLDIAVEDFFWAAITPAQGALMSMGYPPPDPKATANDMRTHFVKEGLLEEKWADFLEEVMKLRKDIEHGKIKEVSAKTVHEMLTKAEEYIKRIDKLVVQIERIAVKKEIKQLFDKTMEDVTAALKMVDVSAKATDIVSKFKSAIIDKKLAPSKYGEVLDRIVELNKAGTGNRREVSSLTFEQDKLAKDTFEHIRAEKGRDVERYKLLATYADKKKQATIWLLTNIAYVLVDDVPTKVKVTKYNIDKEGALTDAENVTRDVLNGAVEKFEGTPTTLTEKTMASLKKILGADLELIVGG